MDHFLGCDKFLLTCSHILDGHFALCDLVVPGKRHECDSLCVGIAHLLLHLGLVGVDLRADARPACGCGQRETVGRLLLTEVDKEQLGGCRSLLWIEIESVEHIVDAVGTEADAHAGEARHAEDAREVVVAATP